MYGGSGVEKVVIDYINNFCRSGSTIVELGAGDVSTKYLSWNYNLYSVESDEKYMGKYDSNYIHAPIVDGWYDPKVLRKALPGDEMVVLVDGPFGDRSGILKNMHLFNENALFIVHDTYRPRERKIAFGISEYTKMPVTFYNNHEKDYFAVI